MKRHRLSEVSWIVSCGDARFARWLKRQIRSLVQALGCSEARFLRSPAAGLSVAVGTLTSSAAIAQAHAQGLLAGVETLAGDDFLVTRTGLGDREVLFVVGASDRAAGYGVFHLFESLGCRFLISGDVVPRTPRNPVVPALDHRGRTSCEWRGIWFQYCFATNSCMSLRDYGAMFDQMAKMRLNRAVFYHFENEPFIDYRVRGERKIVGDISHPDSGYLSYGRHFSGSYLVKDIEVGRDRFDRKRVAPAEFQKVASSADALNAGTRFMQEVIRLAAERGIRCWLSFLPQFVPLNLAKHARRMPRPHLHWSGLLSASDPFLEEINTARIAAIAESYPGLEGIFLGIPEGYFEDPYPESAAILDREKGDYARALALHKELWGAYWDNDQKLLEQHLLNDIGFVEILKQAIGIAREVAPALRLGVITVCKAYLLTHLHRILPADIVFADIESRSLWTKEGAPLHLFREMTGRECAIIPRAVDDGSMAGMQFNLELYDKDRYLESATENGTAGLVIQTTHIRGNEHNMGFLAAGMWRQDLSPDRFYREYAGAVFGERAAPTMLEAFRLLERNEQAMGGRGLSNMPWNKVPAQIEVLRLFRVHATPFHGVPYGAPFVKLCESRSRVYCASVAALERAGELYARARSLCTPRGREEVDYLAARNSGYLHHLSSLVCLSRIYAEYRAGFALLPSDRQAFTQALHAVVSAARDAEREARAAAEGFAACCRHPTDLGVLWMESSSMVTGTRVLRQFLGNVLAYHEGREYWDHVDWERLFGSCPYPAYGVSQMKEQDATSWEPG